MLLTAVCLGIFASQLYAKRAVAGRLKSGVDAIGAASGAAGSGLLSSVEDQEHLLRTSGIQAVGTQFSPKYSNYSVTYTSSSRALQTSEGNGARNSVLLDPQVTRMTNGGLDDFSGAPLSNESLF